MEKDRKPFETDPSRWQGEVGEQAQKVRKDRGVDDPETRDLDEDDPTVPPALRP